MFLSVDHYAIGVGVAYLLLYALYPAGTLSRGVGRVLSLRIWYPVAQLSYSSYLLHPIVLSRLYSVVASYGLTGVPQAAFYVIGPGLSLVAASILYVFVEKPFMNLRELRPQNAGAIAPGPRLDHQDSSGVVDCEES